MTTRPPRRTLTERERRFVLAYHETGNGSESARRAGYSVKSADVIGPRLCKRPCVVAAIRELTESGASVSIASAKELQEFWTKGIRGQIEGMTLNERLKASELLGRSRGVFIERREVLTASLGQLDWKALLKGGRGGSDAALEEKRDVKRIEAPAIDAQPVQAMPKANAEIPVAREIDSAATAEPAPPRPSSPPQLHVAAGRDALSEVFMNADRRAKDIESTLKKLGL